ncbi:hypothetical protein KQH49_08295 [Mycetohabitans sp. B5]|uniref:hypothetical protein n=1 Tax=Mycetohabitans sp. B5 TaxID=2841846 RepID=UPI00351CC9F1|nr:hypothetical protein [Mycetohabitans sp. B5]
MQPIYPFSRGSYNAMHRRRNSDIVRLGGRDARGDIASQVEHLMRALIERQLYHPAFMLPMIALMQLMVALDFNLTQVILIMVTKGVQSGWHVLHHAVVHLLGCSVKPLGDRDCLCGYH